MGTKQLAAQAPLAHSTLGASSYERWSNCPGSIKLSVGCPNEESAYAAEGTKAHEAAAYYFEHHEFPKGTPLDMIEAVMVYINAVFADEREVYGKSGVQSFTEHRLDLSSLHPCMFGTADRVAIYPSLKLLRVYDYKHGAGIPVEVTDNGQLKYYGLGAYIEMATQYQIETIELIIVQPRCHHSDGPVRRWQISAIDLLNFGKELAKNASRTQESNPVLLSGKHCRFCPAKVKCPELKNLALRAAQVEFTPASNAPSETYRYDGQELAQWLGRLDALEEFIKAIREFSYQEAMHGRTPPGFKLVNKKSSRDWAPNVNASTIAMEFGLAEPSEYLVIKEPVLKSPAMIEKLLSKEDKKLLAQFVVSESSGLTLAPESDKRPAVTIAATEFSVLPTQTEPVNNDVIDLFS